MAYETIRQAVGGALQQKLFEQSPTGKQQLLGQQLRNQLMAQQMEQLFPLQVQQLQKQLEFMISPEEEKTAKIGLAQRLGEIQNMYSSQLSEQKHQQSLDEIEAQRKAQIDVASTPRTSISLKAGETGEKIPFQSTPEGLKAITTLKDVANNITKEYQVIRENMGQIEIATQRILDNPKISQIGTGEAIIASYKRMLDPASVVRESEYARTPLSQALKDKITTWFNRMSQSGVVLTTANLKEIRDTARELENWRMANVNQRLEEEVHQQAIDMGLDVNRIQPVYDDLQSKITELTGTRLTDVETTTNNSGAKNTVNPSTAKEPIKIYDQTQLLQHSMSIIGK